MKFGLVLLWTVTVLTPLGILPHGGSYDGSDWRVEVAYYFLFGAYYPPSRYSKPSGWIIGPAYLAVIVMLILFFITYAFQVTIYCINP